LLIHRSRFRRPLFMYATLMIKGIKLTIAEERDHRRKLRLADSS